MEVRLVRICAVALTLAGCGSLVAGENAWTTSGPPGAISALASSREGSAIYAAAIVGGRSIAFRSRNHGESWDPIGEATPNTSISALLTDPQQPETVYGATAGSGMSSFNGFGGNAYRSFDSGSTWEFRGALYFTNVASLAIQPIEGSALFGAGTACWCVRIPCASGMACGLGFLRSRDAGATWFRCAAGLLGTKLTTVATDPDQPNRVFAGGDRGVFVSDDQAEHWSPINFGLESCPFINALAVGSSDVFAAAGKNIPESFTCGGVYRSADAGKTWTAAGLAQRLVTALAIDPDDSRILYAGTSGTGPLFAGGVFRSVDGGVTWSPLGEIPGRPDISRIVVESSGSLRFIHAGTPAGVFDYEILAGARPPVVPGRDRETRTLPSRP